MYSVPIVVSLTFNLLQMEALKTAALIPAAGSGSRMGLALPKQFYELAGVPILVHTLRRIGEADSIGTMILVVPSDHHAWAVRLVQEYQLPKVSQVIGGGERRQDSVQAGLEALPEEVDLVLVHDGVRPFVPLSVIENCLHEAKQSGAAMAAIPAKDTLKSVSSEKIVKHTIDRSGIWQAQTPQAARVSLLKKAYAKAAEKKEFGATDEAALLEFAGIPVKVVEGAEINIKITGPEDLILAKAILMESQDDKDIHQVPGDCRTGYGYDAHRLVNNRPLILGGVTVPHEKGLQGHSDADVLTHALGDAILGAAGQGDIGQHFPDTDENYKNINSLNILERVVDMVSMQGYELANADVTVIAQQPKLAPYFETMQENLATACQVDRSCINLKATTTEGMGFVGREEGMAAHAVVLLRKK
jgi:2-C-methyl-D-erythritol 4-phosphate cytidylyltransferase/2-C-methyl-D-erythritol 2,4-cyclodiphosphate synthase